MLRAERLTKTFKTGQTELTVLADVSFELEKGDTTAIVGPSGSGKTTLLGLCAGLDQPTSGSVTLDGIRLNDLNEDERAAVRSRHVGFIFQSFQLIPTLTAVENVMVPAELLGITNAADRALDLLDRVGLVDRQGHYPSQLSGGERQRVAIARAYINRPGILFADEPTGNLDEDTSRRVEDLLFMLNREAGTTLVVVTHDLDLARQAERMIQLRGGRIHADSRAVQLQD